MSWCAVAGDKSLDEGCPVQPMRKPSTLVRGCRRRNLEVGINFSRTRASNVTMMFGGLKRHYVILAPYQVVVCEK